LERREEEQCFHEEAKAGIQGDHVLY